MSLRWMTAAEIAEARLPGLPANKRVVNRLVVEQGWEHKRCAKGRPVWRDRAGRGGGREWNVAAILPAAAAVAAVRDDHSDDVGSIWQSRMDAYEHLPLWQRVEAERRLKLVQAVEAITPQRGKTFAVFAVAAEHQVAKTAIYDWLRLCQGVPVPARLAALVPQPKGKPAKAEISADALLWIKGAWLRPAQPTFEACYRQLERAAPKHQWIVPSIKTVQRRVMAEVPVHQRVLMREGIEALTRMYPAQERDRTQFAAMDCVCADGHRWDVFVRYPDGTIDRPIMLAFQDLHSNKIVSWRLGRSESAHLVALALHDLVRDHGVPKACWLDNGRGFASKWITGQTENRFRFQVRDTDPPGLLTMMGVQVHWAKPYSGQSKPIERAFRDLASDVAKHPAFDGAYTGNKPTAKPSDYATTAVPFEVFEQIVRIEIAAHNAREGRRTQVCGGRLSFDQAFDLSLSRRSLAPLTVADSQLRMFLMQAEHAVVRRPEGSIFVSGNRYWHEALAEYMGRRLVVRFDPDNLHEPLAVFHPDGRLLALADCIEATGFDSAADAKAHERRRKAWLKANKAMADAEQWFSAARVARDLADDDFNELPSEASPPPPKVRRLLPGLASVAVAALQDDYFDDVLEAATRASERLGRHAFTVIDGGRDSEAGG